MKNPVDCGAFRDSIFRYQADEVSAAERAALRDHLDACPGCARRLEIEDAFLRVLRSKLERAPAPPGLETRVRAALREERSRRRAGQRWFRAPWFAAAAASLLLALLLIPGLDRDGAAHVVHVEQEVTVVDRDCDRAGKTLAQQRKCVLRDHLNALKLRDGTYWNIGLHHEPYRAMLVDAAARGRRLRVVGEYYGGIQTLQVRRVERLGPDTL